MKLGPKDLPWLWWEVHIRPLSGLLYVRLGPRAHAWYFRMKRPTPSS